MRSAARSLLHPSASWASLKCGLLEAVRVLQTAGALKRRSKQFTAATVGSESIRSASIEETHFGECPGTGHG